MATIKYLEELIKPYENASEWGASDGFGNNYQGYKNEEKISRLDTLKGFMLRDPQKVYKNELFRVIKELGLEISVEGKFKI